MPGSVYSDTQEVACCTRLLHQHQHLCTCVSANGVFDTGPRIEVKNAAVKVQNEHAAYPRTNPHQKKRTLFERRPAFEGGPLAVWYLSDSVAAWVIGGNLAITFLRSLGCSAVGLFCGRLSVVAGPVSAVVLPAASKSEVSLDLCVTLSLSFAFSLPLSFSLSLYLFHSLSASQYFSVSLPFPLSLPALL